MGCCLAEAAIRLGHEVTLISGPVQIEYPKQARVIPVVSTHEMLEAAREHFEECDGMIGVAAPCDYQPQKVADQKISKTGEPILLELIETPDVVATLGASKGERWVVGFALETDDQRFRALTKLEKKRCNMMVLNGPAAMDSDENRVEVLTKEDGVIAEFAGQKRDIAVEIMRVIQRELIKSEMPG